MSKKNVANIPPFSVYPNKAAYFTLILASIVMSIFYLLISKTTPISPAAPYSSKPLSIPY